MATIAGGLLVLACGVSGSLALLYRARQMRLQERDYDITTPYLQHIAGGIGAVVGLIIGGIAVYFLSLNQQSPLIAWIGCFSYILIAGASGGHVLSLVYTTLCLGREEQAWKRQRGPGSRTLGQHRIEALKRLRRRYKHYIDLKTRDDVVLEELVGVLGQSLLLLRQSLNRLPFYGYLGTICGILLMAQELSKINEATETFKVLSSMAQGLELAFRTTLVALLAYLPLRKAVDYLMQRLRALEDNWVKLREEQEEVER